MTLLNPLLNMKKCQGHGVANALEAVSKIQKSNVCAVVSPVSK